MKTFCSLIISAVISISAFGQGWNVDSLGTIYDYWGTIGDVQIQGEYAYTLTSITGLKVVDISNPSGPVEVGKCNLQHPIADIAIAGRYAYLTSSDRLLYILGSSPN